VSAVADFETRRFQTAAAHYLRGRPPYPDQLIARVAQLIPLDRDSRLLDLGCGPGQLALAFAPRVGEVVAMDPEPIMLGMAQEAAKLQPNVRIVQGGSTDLGPELGRLDAAVIGRAFHWMDREQTLADLDALIEPDGAVVLVGETYPELPENARIRAFRTFMQDWSAGDESHVIRRGTPYTPHASVLLASPFSRLERIEVIVRNPLSREVMVDRILSFSSTSRARLGERADAMLAELQARMAEWEASGPMEEVLASEALIAWRP
jgi:ubiquinone/menaquinone biosynthesis C-methylase UbiE